MDSVLLEIYRYVEPGLSGGPVPVFGTRAWAELSDDDPAKFAAVVRAALAHWGVEEAAVEARVQASHAVSAAHDWAAQAAEPTRAELLRRRAS